MKAKATEGGVMVSVYVHPSARENKIDVEDGIEIRTREPAEKNRANMAVIKMLSRALGIPQGNISIVRGENSRVKEIYIMGVSLKELECSIVTADDAKFKV